VYFGCKSTMELTIEQALQRAVEAHKAGRLQDAESLYRAILQTQPKHPDANHNLGVLAVSLNNTEAALPLFKIALEANPNQGQFWISYVDALIREKQFDNARSLLDQGMKRGLAEEMIEALEGQLVQLDVYFKSQMTEANKLSKAIELREIGRYQEAQDCLTKYLEVESNDAEGWSLLSQLLLLDKKNAQAEKAIATAKSINPNLPSIYRNQARWLLKNSKPVEALIEAQSGYDHSTDDPESWIVLATCLGANQRDLEALPLIERALKTKPNYAEAFANKGLIKLRLKNTSGAIEDLEKAVALKPHLTQIWEILGTLRYQNKNLSGAIEALKKAQALEPDNVNRMINLGEFLRQDQRTEEAIAIFEEATEKVPENVSVWINLGTALQQGNKMEKAKVAYKKALAINPNSAVVCNNLGSIAKDTKDLESAQMYFEQAITFSPDLAEAHNNLGIILKERGKLEDAVVSYKKAIAIKPNYAEAHSNLGNTLKELGRPEDAETSYKKAIAIKPDLAETHSNLGITLKELGRLKEAEESCKKAIAIKPDLAETHTNLGNIFQKLGRLEDAEASFKKAIAIKPDYAEAHSNLGITLKEFGRLDEAETSYKKAIAIKPDFAEAYNNLGNTLKEFGRLEDAEESYKNAITIKPDFATALQNYSSLLAYKSNYIELCKFSDEALNYAALNLVTSDELSIIWESRLYTWIYHPDLNAQEICDEHKIWGRKFAHLGQTGFEDHDRSSKRRLRIGYVSPDFRGHTCRFYFEPLFSQHDHTNFEVFAYSNVLHEDEHTARLKPYFDHWRNILGVSDETVADMIRKDKIDILVDGCGHMANTRLTVFTYKPAPIQVTWLGSAWTTGLQQMDYALFDPYMAPVGTATSEQIVRLPRTWAAFRPGERATQASVKASPVLINGYVTFGYSGRSERLNHRVFKVWGRILARLPQARLVLDFKAFIDPKTQTYYKEFLAQHGIDTTRVYMRNSENIFEGLGDIDILLDSFPHSGGTMLFDAIWMGVPALTLASPRPVGRIGTSLMTNLGLPEWVAKDEQEYEDKAISFAQDIAALASLRSGMRLRMQASPVMDEKGFARDVEGAFETMWRTWVDSSNQKLLKTGNN
jgi:protein O-GlcNAc transferase